MPVVMLGADVAQWRRLTATREGVGDAVEEVFIKGVQTREGKGPIR